MIDAVIRTGWASWTALLIGSAGLFCLVLPRRAWLRVAAVLLASAAGTWLYVSSSPAPRTPLQHIAWLSAALSLLWSICAAVGMSGDRRPPVSQRPGIRFVSVAHMAALMFGVVAAVVQSLVLVMRFTFTAIDAVRGYPWNESLRYGFGSDGLWSLALLSASCAIALVSMRDRHLIACQLWLAVITICWVCLLTPSLEAVGNGTFGRTPALLHLSVGLAGLLFVTALALRWCFRKHVRRMVRAWRRPGPDDEPFLPGFWVSYRIVAVGVVLLTCYHLLVPLDRISGGAAVCAAWASASAAFLAASAYVLFSLPGGWQGAEVLIGSGSLALCAAATVTLPSTWDSLAERYPVMFNAMVVGLTIACLICLRISEVPAGVGAFGKLADRDGMLRYAARRFVFLNGALAVLIATAMALWPRLPTIAVMDDSFERVVAGLGANLGLLFVLLWCARRQARPSFHLLTLLSATATVGFLVVRMLPYTSSIR